ncbi:MAG: FIST N-terminal domain-containing protein [Mariniblastus sp.]
MQNQFAQSHCVTPNLETALSQTTAAINQQFAELDPDNANPNVDLVFAFAAGHEPAAFDEVMRSLQTRTNAKIVLGCTCETAIGGAFEFESEPVLTVWAAKLPAADLVPMQLSFARSAGESAIVGWPDETDGPWPEDSTILLLGDPFSFPVDVLLERMNEDRPGVRLAGGMASGAQTPGQCRLLLNDQTFAEGLVAVRISGANIRTLVSQGCRPIGEPMVITKSERNIIETLGGKPSLDVVHDLFRTLPTREQAVVQNGLHVGRVINEYQDKFEFGDFLIRNMVGVDKKTRSISIGDYVRTGQTVQFHIRDDESASAELQQMVTAATKTQPYRGGLIFTCNGRGMNLFPDPHHDSSVVANHGRKASNEDQTTDTVALAGFFAAGEIGPVGNKNFLHGFTASVVLFD